MELRLGESSRGGTLHRIIKRISGSSCFRIHVDENRDSWSKRSGDKNKDRKDNDREDNECRVKESVINGAEIKFADLRLLRYRFWGVRQQPAARNRLLSRNQRRYGSGIAPRTYGPPQASIYGFAATMWSPLLLSPHELFVILSAMWQRTRRLFIFLSVARVDNLFKLTEKLSFKRLIASDFRLFPLILNRSIWLQRRERRDAEENGRAGEEEDACGWTLFSSPK